MNFWNFDSEENSVPYSAESIFHWIRESCDFRVSLRFREEEEGKRTVFAFYVFSSQTHGTKAVLVLQDWAAIWA